MIHKHFKNDKKGFGICGPLAEAREVSTIEPKQSPYQLIKNPGQWTERHEKMAQKKSSEGSLLPVLASKTNFRSAQDKFDRDKGQKSAISGRRLHWRLSTGFSAFSPVVMCNLVRRAPQNLGKVAENPVEKIASNPVTSVAVMVFSALSSSTNKVPEADVVRPLGVVRSWRDYRRACNQGGDAGGFAGVEDCRGQGWGPIPSRPKLLQKVLPKKNCFGLTAGVFIQSWRWDTPKYSRKTPSFSQNDFGKFLRGGYPNRSSGIHRWGLDLSTGYPNTHFSCFSGYPQLTLVFLLGDEKFWIFSWGACHDNQGLSTSSI